jgi:hypothetical protein
VLVAEGVVDPARWARMYTGIDLDARVRPR